MLEESHWTEPQKSGPCGFGLLDQWTQQGAQKQTHENKYGH